ncbi:hypothetical protein THAOC_02893 [Thalassiosira oceanica]|uniref:Uncharacterized protein n=1 Tax=Thalassiosira oceanica TaxID=159749 RepID=K0T9G1_THAOC|nr:hypothetical protein THAOC_02893 [Thalassiosira oceanica]|eukprot:EJK75383.1 hypothetical protein THAOC_02893 [Thalassiosira oceanica]
MAEGGNDLTKEIEFKLGQKVLSVDGSAPVDGLRPAPLFEAVIRDSSWKNIGQTGEILHQTPKKRKRNHDGGSGATEAASQERVYLVHFQGWNSRFDRWVRTHDIFEFEDNETNRARMMGPTPKKIENLQPHSWQLQSGGSANAVKPEEQSKPAEHHAKSKVKQNLQVISKACELPFTLQAMLVDDKDKITRVVYPFHVEGGPPKGGNIFLHVLPAELSIVEVVGQYIKTAKKEDLLEFAREQQKQRGEASGKEKDDENYDSRRPAFFATRIGSKELLKSRKSKRKKFAIDIVSLFDASAELFLLYEQERDRHARLVRKMNGSNGAKKDESSSLLSAKYGAVHLLRLFVKLPEILSKYGMPITNIRDGEREGEKNTRQAQDEDILFSRDKSNNFAGFLSELIVYLQQHVDELFKLNYEAVDITEE